MEANYFQILLIDVTFCFYRVQNVVRNVQIKNEKPNIIGTSG